VASTVVNCSAEGVSEAERPHRTGFLSLEVSLFPSQEVNQVKVEQIVSALSDFLSDSKRLRYHIATAIILSFRKRCVTQLIMC